MRTHSDLVGAELLLQPGSELQFTIDPGFEHGLLVDSGDVVLDGHRVPVDHLAYLPTGHREFVLVARDRPVRALLIGGEPLDEQIVMWWNFVGRSHDEIVRYRAEWMAEIGADGSPPAVITTDPALVARDGTPRPRFGTFPAGEPDPLPAPSLPNIRMRPRG